MGERRWIGGLGAWIVIVLVAGALFAITDDGPTPAASTTSSAPDATTEAIPPNEVRIRGDLTGATIDGSLADDLPLPFSAEAATPGSPNGATLDGIVVEGAEAAIAWDASRSLVVNGDGRLDLDQTRFTLDGSFLAVQLGGSTHAFVPGTYRIDTPVTVSVGGPAERRDSVSFSVPAHGALAVTGDVATTLPSGTWRFTGPGTVRMTGALDVETAAGPESATSIVLPQGAFEITLTGDQGLWAVEARLQGPVELR